jgi:hypothetical protein
MIEKLNLMKCRYCGAEVPNGACFCPNCGRNLSQLSEGVNSGETIDGGDNKKWIILVVVLLVAAGGVFFFLHQSKPKEEVSNTTTAVAKPEAKQSVESVKAVKAVDDDDKPVLNNVQAKIVRILYRYITTTGPQPFTKLGFKHIGYLASDNYFHENYYASEGVELKSNASPDYYSIDSEGYHFHDNRFSGMKKNSLAIIDMHCEDYSPTCFVYKDDRITEELIRQLKALDFHYSSRESGWLDAQNDYLVTFGNFTDDPSCHVFAIGHWMR